MSDFERVKDVASLTEFANTHLQREGRTFVCPNCNSGLGPNKSPAFSIKKNLFKCFSCGVGGDVFDLAGIVEGTEDKTEQLRIVAKWAGVGLSSSAEGERTPAKVKKVKTIEAPDYSENIRRERENVVKWRANLEHPDALKYLDERGVTLEQARSWGFGYDPDRKRLIIPYRGSDFYHIDRDITGLRHKYDKPKADEVGAQPFENPDALKEDVVFAVEGLLDALALESCGLNSTALNGTSWNNAADYITGSFYRGTVIIALDNDPADVVEEDGKTKKEKTDAKARAFLEHLHAAGVSARLSGALEAVGCNDPWEACADPATREKFKKHLEMERIQAEEDALRAAEHEYNEALKNLSVKDTSQALHDLITLSNVEDPIPTGFSNLDDALNGGLRSGLTILGALSSMGKTTLMLQIADQIAESGKPVLYVTIEQSAQELVAKSLSRIMELNKPSTGARYFTTSSQEIRTKSERLKWKEAQTAALYDAVDVYQAKVSPNLLFLEGLRQPSVESIKQAADMIKRKRGEYPVVFIDYLQLLAPKDKRQTDKQAVDENVSDLRIMAKDKIPVFVVSSLNRESYSGLIEMTSFKESGAIEYSSDVLLGLQPENMKRRLIKKTKKGELKMTMGEERKLRGLSIIEEVKDQPVREVEMLILKNREGKILGNNKALKFTYRTIPNLFEER